MQTENKKLTRADKRAARDELRNQAKEERRGSRILDALIRRAIIRNALVINPPALNTRAQM
jgi:hypothetical protein